MESAEHFVMEIEDVFKLSNGFTAIVGIVTSGIKLNLPIQFECNLIIDESISQRIEVGITFSTPRRRNMQDIEDFYERKAKGYRDLWTRDSVNLDHDIVKTHRCRLVSFLSGEPCQ